MIVCFSVALQVRISVVAARPIQWRSACRIAAIAVAVVLLLRFVFGGKKKASADAGARKRPNVADSEVIASVAALAGYDMADDVADADAVMLNTRLD